jgi:hypothetical protein
MSNETKARGAGSKLKWAALAVAVLLAGGGAAFMFMRGPSGATAALGGSLPATPAPELPADASRWVNGEPVTLAAARGQLLFVDGWHPA